MAALEELRTRFQPGLRLEVNGALLILKTSENQDLGFWVLGSGWLGRRALR